MNKGNKLLHAFEQLRARLVELHDELMKRFDQLDHIIADWREDMRKMREQREQKRRRKSSESGSTTC